MNWKWNRGMVAILWHAQTKWRATVNTNSNLNRAPVLDSTQHLSRGMILIHVELVQKETYADAI
jgi:hypothetical protein